MKKQLVLFMVVLCMSFMAHTSSVQAQNEEDPYVILVEFTFDERTVDEAIDLLLEMQEQTLENEEGCLVYDVMLSEENPAKIFIYESYENEAAFTIHQRSSYHKAIITEKLSPLLKESKVTKVIPLNQDEIFGEGLTDGEV